MKLSLFGEKITKESGISDLMEDLGESFHIQEKSYMFGGGNPAHIPQIQDIFNRHAKISGACSRVG